MTSDDRLRVGLLGCGTVGSEVARLLTEDPRMAARFRLVAVAVRDPRRSRASDVGGDVLTTDAVAVANRADVDVVVEVIGGLDPARRAVEDALARGVPVVSANKALFARHGPELRALAARYGTEVRFEASVAAAVPVVEVVQQLARTDEVARIEGVLNGTCNFVLSEMESTGATLEQAVVRAQQLGYAEADPSRDLDGTDAADKIAVLAQLAWGTDASTCDVQRLGIEALTPEDLASARSAGRTWRLVATATVDGCLRVEPRQLSRNHPLAQLDGPTNGVMLSSAYTGSLLLTGAGAGGLATASAIIADLDRITRPGVRPAAGVGA